MPVPALILVISVSTHRGLLRGRLSILPAMALLRVCVLLAGRPGPGLVMVEAGVGGLRKDPRMPMGELYPINTEFPIGPGAWTAPGGLYPTNISSPGCLHPWPALSGLSGKVMSSPGCLYITLDGDIGIPTGLLAKEYGPTGLLGNGYCACE